MSMILHSLVRQNSEENCGISCLATVAKHEGRTWALSRVREAFGTGQGVHPCKG